MKMKQYVCLALALVLLMSLFSACGGQGEETHTSSASTEDAATEATTEETTQAATEPLPTEILSWEQDGFSIGQSIVTFDRQGNKIREDKDFHYEDGSLLIGFTCFNSAGRITDEEISEYHPNGKLKTYTCRKCNTEGTLVTKIEEVYDESGNSVLYSHLTYDPERNLWAIDLECGYITSYGAETHHIHKSVHGLSTSSDPSGWDTMIEGTFQEFYTETGYLSYDAVRYADGTGKCNEYWEDGSPKYIHEYTFDADTNTYKTVRFAYERDGSLRDHSEIEDTYDSNGNVIKHIDYFFDENDIYTHKWVYEYQYNDAGNVSWDARTCYDPDGNHSMNSSSEENFYTYNLDGQLIEYTKILDYHDFLSTTDYTYEYNAQGLVSKKHVVSERSDLERPSELFCEYEYNEQGLRTLEYKCDPYADIRGNIETYTIYTYDENGQCTLVEVAEYVAGEQTDYDAFESDGSGYIYGEYGTQLYPYADPLNDH